MAFVFIATTFIGWNQALVFPNRTIAIRDQEEIGTTASIAGSARSVISTIASTTYSVVLTARVTETLSTQVPVAVIEAGLPACSVAGYMTTIAAGGVQSLLDAVQGLTPEVLATGGEAYRWAYNDAYETVLLTSLAFGALGIICSLFIADIGPLVGYKVVTLTVREKERKTIKV